MEELTERAHLAVLISAREARDLGRPTVGAAELLVGLAEEDEGRAARVLAEHGLGSGALREALAMARAEVGEEDSAAGPDVDPDDGASAVSPPLSAAGARVLERARTEARWDGRERVATEHLLLAVLHECSGPALRVLLDAGVHEDGLRARLVRPRR